MAARQNILVRFGARARELRLSKGYSQESFAAKCNLDRTYMGGVAFGASGILESKMLKEFSHGGYKPHRSLIVACPLACREWRGNHQDSDRRRGVE